MADEATRPTVSGTLSGSLVALEFLTPWRLRRVQTYSDRTFAEALGWYPAIGLLIGLVLMLVDRYVLSELWSPLPAAALLVALLALASGGLHLDGVADTADGLALQGDRAERLTVMSEGNTGPAGVMALLLVLLIEFAAIASLHEEVRSAALLLGPALGRWAVVPMALTFRPARPAGLGHAIHEGLWPVAVPLATAVGGVAAVALFGAGGLVLVLLAAAAAIVVGALAARMLDGVTGDIYGAGIEVSTVVVWLAIAAAFEQDWLTATILT
jgi:adenosylcobinamide-GDP ribazoletransferase